MATALLLNSMPDIRHCLMKGLHKGSLLFSMHPGVDAILREEYQLSCRCLSRFIAHKEIFSFKELASAQVDVLLDYLDNRIAPLLNERHQLRMRYFRPLYSYLGKYHYFRNLALLAMVRGIISEFRIDKLLIYDAPLNQFLSGCTATLSRVFPRFLDNVALEFLSGEGEGTKDRWKMEGIAIHQLFLNLTREPFRRVGRLLGLLDIYCQARGNPSRRQSLLIYERLYNLQGVLPNLRRYHLIYYLAQGEAPLGFKKKKWHHPTALSVEAAALPDNGNPYDRLFVEDACDDFSCHIGSYEDSIETLKEIRDRHDIRAGIWGVPPISGLKSLIFEYLQSEGIPVIGAQHGSVYGDSYKPWHFDSDFSRCDRFLSFGFTREDLQRLYPGKAISCAIDPVGMALAQEYSQRKRKIDVLFPLANSLSVLAEGLSRLPPHELADRQAAILKYLDSRSGLDVYVKPVPFSTVEMCCQMPLLRRLKNLRVVDDMSLEYFLRRYHPRIVIIEFPSTPLFEVLPLDMEIFLMNDPIQPFEKRALELLQRRVHYCEDVGVLIRDLEDFIEGRCPPKRDGGFVGHYVRRNDVFSGIQGIIDGIVRNH